MFTLIFTQQQIWLLPSYYIFKKTYTNTLDFSRKNYILYNNIVYVRILSTNIRKSQDYLILYNLHSIKGANFPYKIPSDWIETSHTINLIKSGTEINFMIVLFSFRKIGIACFMVCLTKCFKNLTYIWKLPKPKPKLLISKEYFVLYYLYS